MSSSFPLASHEPSPWLATKKEGGKEKTKVQNKKRKIIKN